MREIERRVRRLEDTDPTRRRECFAISDCPENNRGDQTQHTMNGGKVVYWLQERVMSAEEWIGRYCTPD
jgi:hypothetical protein